MIKRQKKIPDEQLKELVRKAIETDQYEFSLHALERMNEREINVPLVIKTLLFGTRVKSKDRIDEITGDWRYAFQYNNEEIKQPIIAIVKMVKKLFIITIMWDQRYERRRKNS